ncbi:MAG: helix-turn-helix domain-containing protein [Prolixibacteraceae bacterium]|nr:helix-turn-helix domain-containing protein [Prolixibacteraceae bacterium]
MKDKEFSITEYLERIDERQQNIEKLLLSQKNVLTFDEAAEFIGISKSHLYKLTMCNSLPFYRPRGKMIYMDRVELENWLLQNRITPADEIEVKASTYSVLNKK